MSPEPGHDISFLERLLDSPGPSGFESRPARVWRDEAGAFARTWSDVVGNSYAAVRRDARPLALLAGHIDEIGLQVTHADKSGLLYFGGIGGWDPQVMVGQRLPLGVIHGKESSKVNWDCTICCPCPMVASDSGAPRFAANRQRKAGFSGRQRGRSDGLSSSRPVPTSNQDGLE